MSKNLFGARLVRVLRERLLQRSKFWPAIEPATVIVLEQGLNAKGVKIGNIMQLKIYTNMYALDYY